MDKRLDCYRSIEGAILEAHPGWNELLRLERPPILDKSQIFDLAIPCFPMAKAERKAPPKIAEQLAGQLKKQAEQLQIDGVEVIKAYVNIRFKAEALGAAVLKRMKDPLVDSKLALQSEKLVVDFSSPNIAKPFGFGHLRSTNIGAAVCRINSALGAEVVRVNHLGDWGTQFGKLITAYKRFGNADFVKGDPINNLYRLYVQFHEEEKDDPALIDEARDWFVKLEKGDEEAKELWSWFKDVSYHEFKKVYDRLGVEFDYVTGESFYNELMPETIDRLKEKKLLQESEGALVVDLDEYDMPPCLIQKTDGSTLYATRDIATAEYRMKTFEPTRLVYVVGSEQKLHFRQVYKVIELMGYDWAQNWKHVDFGLIKSSEGKMSTRKGNIVLLEDVLNQAEEKALSIIKEKEQTKPEERRLSDEEQLEVAKKVGTGAVVFFDLKAKRTKDVLFDWDEILSFEGDSGPYLQYSYVRLGALLDKAGQAGVELSDTAQPDFKTEEERALALSLLNFPATVEAAAREFEPSMVSHELLEIAAVFNRFYMNVPILKGEASQIPGRLNLVRLTQRVIQEGLALLGIQCPSKM